MRKELTIKQFLTIKLFFVHVLFFHTLIIQAQVNKTEIENVSHFLTHLKGNDTFDFIVVRLQGESINSLFKYNKPTNTAELLGQIPTSLYPFNNSEIQYISTENGAYFKTNHFDNNQTTSRLNWIDLDGNQFTSSQQYSSLQLVGSNNTDLFYITEELNGSKTLKKTEPELMSSIDIQSNISTLLSYYSSDNLELFSFKTEPNQVKFYLYSISLGFTEIFSVETTANYIHFLDVLDEEIYYRIVTNTNDDLIIRIDLNQNTGSLVCDIPKPFRVDLPNNTRYNYNTNNLIRGPLEGGPMDTIYYSHKFQDKIPVLKEIINSNIIRAYAYNFGFESFYVSDSVYLLKDIGQGIQSGWPSLDIDNPAFWDLNHNSEFILQDEIGTTYTLMTNYSDAHLYLYSISDTNIASLFPIEYSAQIVSKYISNGQLNWIIFKENKLIIQNRSLSENLVPQAPVQTSDTSLIWGKNLTYLHSEHFILPNHRHQLSGIKLTKDGSLITALRMSSTDNYIMADDFYTLNEKAVGVFQVHKHDPYGKLLWQRSFGPKTFIPTSSFSFLMDLDDEDNVFVAGSFAFNFYNNFDTLTIPRCANFIMKIDGQSGETEWFKLISESYYLDDVTLEKLKIIDNELYLTFSYLNFSCTFEQFELSNQIVSPMNAFSKFDVEGNLLLAVNNPINWQNIPGTNSILDKYKNEIYALYRQAKYTFNSSCNYMDWGINGRVVSATGEADPNLTFSFNDLGSITTGFVNDENLYSFGFYRGYLDLYSYSNETPAGLNCHKNRGIILKYAILNKNFVEMQISKEEFYPFDSKIVDSFFYIYGATEKNNLLLLKFSQDGKEVGYKELGQEIHEFDFKDNLFFDVSDDYIAVIGSMFKESDEYKIPRKAGPHLYTTILKTANKNWKTDKRFFEKRDVNFTSDIDDHLVVFPNPFSEQFTVMFKELIYTSMEIMDINGKIIDRIKLNEEKVQVFEFAHLSQGLYFLNFSNNHENKIVKVLRL